MSTPLQFYPAGPFKTFSPELKRLLELTEKICAGAFGHDITFAFEDALEAVESKISKKPKVLFAPRHKILRKNARSRSAGTKKSS